MYAQGDVDDVWEYAGYVWEVVSCRKGENVGGMLWEQKGEFTTTTIKTATITTISLTPTTTNKTAPTKLITAITHTLIHSWDIIQMFIETKTHTIFTRVHGCAVFIWCY